MPRARRKPYAPPPQTTDTGPDTPAQRYGAVYSRPKDGRAGEVRKIREHPLVTMARRGVITDGQRDRGLAALDLLERTMLSPSRSGVYVDATLDPSAIAAHATENAFRYAAAIREIPHVSREVFAHVVEEGRHLATFPGCARLPATRRRVVNLLRVALDAVRA